MQKKLQIPNSRTQIAASLEELFKRVEEEPQTGTSGQEFTAGSYWLSAMGFISSKASPYMPVSGVGEFLSYVREDTELKRDIRNQNQLIIQLLQTLIASFKSSEPEGVHEFEVRDLSEEQAKSEILELFQKSPKLFYSDIAEKLHLDLPLVVKICNMLEAEGKIKPES